MQSTSEPTASQIRAELQAAIDAAVADAGSSEARRPQHRVPFVWPPHPVSADFHVLSSEWTGEASVRVDAETMYVKVARTPYGVFGRCEGCWAEARGDSEAQMLAEMAKVVEPLFARQREIARAIGRPGRYAGSIRDLAPGDLLKLLYSNDRDIAHAALVEIETHASTNLFGDALILVLQDTKHPNRRSAQWCVLDMFEDLPSFVPDPERQGVAIQAIRDLIWSAPDDYARTIYKAGVVLGGHIATEPAADALIACIFAPSKIGRRSAIHAVFHLAEWLPGRRGEIVDSLQRAAKIDAEPLLRDFAAHMAQDVERGDVDHVMEPVFDGE